jgi:uncharacterized coiled-coil DUF342 family protein
MGFNIIEVLKAEFFNKKAVAESFRDRAQEYMQAATALENEAIKIADKINELGETNF